MRLAVLVLPVLILILTGCAGPRTAPAPMEGDVALPGGGVYKVGKPYVIAGRRYTPRVQPGYSEIGLASWYGPAFDGKLTANGELFDQYAITAAHKTLPLPSRVRVINLENGRELVVRVNDRGPFVGDRIIDLSRRSAQLLGIEQAGVGRVRIDLIDSGLHLLAKNAPPLPTETPAIPVPSTANTSLYVQVGAFLEPANAEEMAGRLSSFGKTDILPRATERGTFHLVLLGPLEDTASADDLVVRLMEEGHDSRVFLVER